MLARQPIGLNEARKLILQQVASSGSAENSLMNMFKRFVIKEMSSYFASFSFKLLHAPKKVQTSSSDNF
jgi:hypothetical protein